MTSNVHNQPLPSADVALLKRLIAASCDGFLQPSERDQLEQLLVTSREARSIYRAYMQLDSGLDWKVRGNQSLGGLVDLSRDPNRAASLMTLRLAAQPAPPRTARRLLYVAAALAASIAFLFAFFQWKSAQSRPELAGGAGSKKAESREPVETRAVGANDPALARIVKLSDECRWFVENGRNGEGNIRAGETIRVTKGQLRLEFTCGATVTMRSPAALQVISPMRTRAVLGTLTAHVAKGAEGFTVETPRTTVVDLGTDFGIDVTGHGSTDVVVFNGAVDLHYDDVQGLRSNQRLRAGEALRVNEEGTASRIVSIMDNQYSIADGTEAVRGRAPVISSVRDNIRRGDSWYYYEIVRGGMREDAKAFVDRKDHEWNGVSAAGIPSYLLGADYVKTFNDDKLNREVEIQVKLDRPAIVYVLLDKRSPVPDWLRDTFFNTGDEIGIDGGGYARFGEKKISGIGPGVSIDDTFSIWRCDVPAAGIVTLGAIQLGGETHNMYGIVAVPMEFRDGRDVIAGSATHPSRESMPIAPNSEGKLAKDGAIERPDDVDVFKFDWHGGVVEVACRTNGFTTLEPVISVYDSSEALVGYARTKRASRDCAAVAMNLPAGRYYAAVAGGDGVGQVGEYRLEINPASGDIAAPLPPADSIAFKAAPTQSGMKLTWDPLPQAESYTVERSRDAVTFQAVTTTPDSSAIDDGLKAGATYIYRLRAKAGLEQMASAPLLVRTCAAAVKHLQGFGQSPQSILLEWHDIIGEKAYRIERSNDGSQFAAIGTAPQNSSGFRDLDVEPGKRYFYRVATVNPVGEDAVSEPIGAMSGVADLSAAAVASDRVVLTWKTDYHQSRLFVMRATNGDEFVTIGGLEGDAHEFVDTTAVAGKLLRYRVVAVEDQTSLKEIRATEIDDIRLPELVSDDHFALRFTGKIRIDKPGKYNFYTNSDDGSRVFLDGTLVVDNDGRHAQQMVCGTTKLAAGIHDLEVQYFEHDGKSLVELWWAGQGNSMQKVPQSILSSLTCHYYENIWWRLPFDRTTALSQTVTVTIPEAVTIPADRTSALPQGQ